MYFYYFFPRSLNIITGYPHTHGSVYQNELFVKYRSGLNGHVIILYNASQ